MKRLHVTYLPALFIGKPRRQEETSIPQSQTRRMSQRFDVVGKQSACWRYCLVDRKKKKNARQKGRHSYNVSPCYASRWYVRTYLLCNSHVRLGRCTWNVRSNTCGSGTRDTHLAINDDMGHERTHARSPGTLKCNFVITKFFRADT